MRSVSDFSSTSIFSSKVLIFSSSPRRFSSSFSSCSMVEALLSSCFFLKVSVSFISVYCSSLGRFSLCARWREVCSRRPTIIFWARFCSSNSCTICSSKVSRKRVISLSRSSNAAYFCASPAAPPVPPRRSSTSLCTSLICLRFSRHSSSASSICLPSSWIFWLSSFTFSSSRARASSGDNLLVSSSVSRFSFSCRKLSSCLERDL
mmetsp:Transcript_4095/g.8840  ORF Transcript_4095/g.8840 Transcript_4095/m.8840 type:complete len:206 (-) Transcript_4095:930-1547(-)